MDFRLLCVVTCVLSFRFSSGQRLVSSGKTISSSSFVNTWTADKAVDGDARRTPNSCNCCAATKNEYEPWYKLDLGQQYKIYSISVLGRGGSGDGGNPVGYGHTLKNMEIKLGTTESGGQILTQYTGNDYTYNYTLPTPQEGRYLTLTLRGMTLYFIICELNVYAECADSYYSNDCSQRCFCVNGPCDKATGICPAGGCTEGYKGDTCNTQCEDGTFGLGCNEECGKCLDRKTCDKINGTCSECEPGYTDPLCKLLQNTDLNAQNSEAKIYQLAIAIVGTIAVVSIIGNVIAAICYVILQRRKHRDRPINSPPDICSPYELANRSAFETEHQYGQTTPVYEEPEVPYEIAK